ncbi:hypothetical protein K6L09_20895 [Burkholderia cepacia]
MILGAKYIGTVAKYGLMEMESETKIDKKLEIEYIHQDNHNFKRYLFNHAYYEGLKTTKWEGKNYYELNLQSISIPTCRKEHINLDFILTYIPESQEVFEATYHSGIDLELSRYTDKAILSHVKEVFRQVAPVFFNLYQEGFNQNGMKKDRFAARKLTNDVLDRIDCYDKIFEYL